MWPWGHAAVGYLLYTVWSRLCAGKPPLGGAVLFLAVGTQFPDLIDKPLAWTFEILPSGRTLGHTLLFTIPVWVGLYLVCKKYTRTRPEWASAFAVGALSHVLGDGLLPLLWGDSVYAPALLWPILSGPTYDTASRSILGHFLTMELTGFATFQFALTGIAVAVWVKDGRPGWMYVRSPVMTFRAVFGIDNDPE